MTDKIILTGFMGAGKSSIGAELSKQLKAELIDTDSCIEKEQNRSISDIFAADGESYFRELETRLLYNLRERKGRAVISCGGGMVLREENRRLLKEIGTVVYLKVQPITVIRRLRGDNSRPLLAGADAASRVERLMRERESAYLDAADIVLESDAFTKRQNAEKIIELISSR